MSRLEPACQRAYDFLDAAKVKPVAQYLPRESPNYYIPSRVVDALFTKNPDGLTLEEIYECDCTRCERDGGTRQNRHNRGFPEQELKGEYATIYAVLIYIWRPGLINLFRRRDIKLRSQYLIQGNLDFLLERDNAVANAKTAIENILDEQYRFLVRTFRPRSEITKIPSKELLPIKEDLRRKGRGAFGEVWCFEFQEDTYRGSEFGNVLYLILTRLK